MESKSVSQSHRLRFRQKIVITNDEGKILIMWAPIGKVWDLPGGHVEIPETHIDALKREMSEELSLTTFPEPKIIFLYTNYKPETDRYAIIACYQIEMRNFNPKLSHEHTEFKWVTKDELKEITDKEPYVTELIDYIE